MAASAGLPAPAAASQPGGARVRAALVPWLVSPALLSLASLAAAAQLLLPGFLDTHAYGDSPFLLWRVIEMARLLREGALPARWAPDFAYGYGYPFFSFYAPLSYYLAGLLHLAGFGVVASIKLTFLLGFLLAAFGAYALAGRLWPAEDEPPEPVINPPALLGALAYTFAPYHLVNVYARGDALAEFSAYALLPWALWAVARLGPTAGGADAALLGLVYGALVFTHNVTALTFSPLLAAFALFWCLARWPRQAARPLLVAAGGAALGLALAAAFWLPALVERPLVHLEHMTTGYFDFHRHFLALERLVQPSLIYDYQLEGPRGPGLPFQIGLAQALAALPGLLVPALLARQRGAGRRSALVAATFAALATLAVVFLTTPFSTPVWETVPLLAFAQFPWRLLSLVALGTTLLAAAGCAMLASGRARLVSSLGFGALLAVGGLGGLAPERMVLSEAELGRERIFEYEYATTSLGTTTRYEYLPATVRERPWASAALLTYPRADLLLAQGPPGAEVVPLQAGAVERAVRAVMPADGRLVFQTYHYPGWTATVDGMSVAVAAEEGSGLLVVEVPAGEHVVGLRFGETPLRLAADLVSLAALALILLLALRRLVRRGAPRPTPALGVLAGAFVLTAVWVSPTAGGSDTPSSDEAGWRTQAADIHSPLATRRPQGIDFGGRLVLQQYRLSTTELRGGDSLELEVLWRGQDGPAPEMVHARLISPSYYLREGESAWAEAEAPIEPRGEDTALPGMAGLSRHLLTVPPGTPPGLYYLQVEPLEGGQPIPLRNRTGQITDRKALLGPLVVRAPAVASPSSEQPLVRFGEALALLGAEVDPPAAPGEPARVVLRWRAEAPIERDLRLSLRLLDGRRQNWGQADRQPLGGFYPTRLWQPGVEVRDPHLLAPLEGAPPGSYRLELRVYALPDTRPLPVRRPDGTAAPAAEIAALAITEPYRGPAARLGIPRSIDALLAPGLVLAGYGPRTPRARAGDDLALTLFWQVEEQPREDWQVGLDLVGGTETLALGRTDPAPAYPSSRWEVGTALRTQVRLPVPPAAQGGTYTLRIQLVSPRGVEVGPPQLLGPVTIDAPERSFALPAVAHPRAADLGDVARLLGYDGADGPLVAGGELSFALYWQALRTAPPNYHVFVHLVGPDGHVVVQQDGTPLAGARPTSGWLAGEVLRDPYRLSLPAALPPGTYRLVAGLYDPIGGARLSVQGQGQGPEDHVALAEFAVGR